MSNEVDLDIPSDANRERDDSLSLVYSTLVATVWLPCTEKMYLESFLLRKQTRDDEQSMQEPPP